MIFFNLIIVITSFLIEFLSETTLYFIEMVERVLLKSYNLKRRSFNSQSNNQRYNDYFKNRNKMHLRLLQKYKPTPKPSVGTPKPSVGTPKPSVGTPTREYFRVKIKSGKFKNLNQQELADIT